MAENCEVGHNPPLYSYLGKLAIARDNFKRGDVVWILGCGCVVKEGGLCPLNHEEGWLLGEGRASAKV